MMDIIDVIMKLLGVAFLLVGILVFSIPFMTAGETYVLIKNVIFLICWIMGIIAVIYGISIMRGDFDI